MSTIWLSCELNMVGWELGSPGPGRMFIGPPSATASILPDFALDKQMVSLQWTSVCLFFLSVLSIFSLILISHAIINVSRTNWTIAPQKLTVTSILSTAVKCKIYQTYCEIWLRLVPLASPSLVYRSDSMFANLNWQLRDRSRMVCCVYVRLIDREPKCNLRDWPM